MYDKDKNKHKQYQKLLVTNGAGPFLISYLSNLTIIKTTVATMWNLALSKLPLESEYFLLKKWQQNKLKFHKTHILIIFGES